MEVCPHALGQTLRNPTFRQTLRSNARFVSFEDRTTFDSFRCVVASQTVLQTAAELDAVAEVLAVQAGFTRSVVTVAITVVHERAAEVVVLRVKRTRRLTLRVVRAVDHGQVLVFACGALALTVLKAVALIGRSDLAEVHARRLDTRFDTLAIRPAGCFRSSAFHFEAFVAGAPRSILGARTRTRTERIRISSSVGDARRRFRADVFQASQGLCTIIRLRTTVPGKTSPKRVLVAVARRKEHSREHENRQSDERNAGPVCATNGAGMAGLSACFHAPEDATTAPQPEWRCQRGARTSAIRASRSRS